MRKSGILLPIFSLPSDYGIGSIGSPALDFIDFLSEAGQYYWLILPINPTAYGDSPYQSPCAFAGNPYFIDLDLLFEKGLISKGELLSQRKPSGEEIDYAFLYKERLPLLKKAAERLKVSTESLAPFEKENAFWLNDYCLFMAYKEMNGMKPLSFFKENAPPPTEGILKKAEIYRRIQYLFFSQWEKLKSYAEKKNVHIIGDMPIYVARDSSDFFAHKSIFQLNEKDEMSFIAGCPPDSFAKGGQLWGNPLYAWEKESCFDWWRERLKQSQKLFHSLRIDHFRGIYEYYAIPSEGRDTSKGTWRRGPGLTFSEMIKEEFPDLEIIGEDLGFMTKEAKNFFRESGFAGMKVLQFAFDDKNSEHLPHNHEKKDFCFTGTHDNPTLFTWICNAEREKLSFAMDYLGGRISQLKERLICAAMGSACESTIIPLQDYMGLGCEGRINTPGTASGNWRFRINKEDLSHKLKEEIYFYTKTYSRNLWEETK